MRSTALHASAKVRLDRMRERIDAAARAVGREAADVRLVAVTKGVDAAGALELFAAGQRDLAESRPQELAAKRAAFDAALGPRADEVRWHLIGHLQRNKLRRALDGLFALHSLDREELVEPLIAAAAERDRPLAVFLQVKLADEASKGGLAPSEVPEIVERLAGAPGVALCGLMTLAPWIDDEPGRRSAARDVFARLAELAGKLRAERFAGGRVELSMGMSGDIEEAVAAGSTCVRVGSALFEEDAR